MNVSGGKAMVILGQAVSTSTAITQREGGRRDKEAKAIQSDKSARRSNPEAFAKPPQHNPRPSSLLSHNIS
jgi:hypothetical protein